MNFSHVYAVIARVYFLVRTNPVRLIPMFLWSILTIVLWGFIAKYLVLVAGTTGSVLAVQFIGAILFWEFLNRVMHSFVMAFLEDVWARNFLNYFASPLTVSEYITGLTSVSAVMSVLAFLVMAVIASLVFDISLAVYGLFLIPLLLSLYLFGIALGIFGAALVFRFGPAAEWLLWPIPAVVTPFVGVFYPVSILPQWMQSIGLALSPTYAFEGMRQIIAGNAVSDMTVLLALGGALGALILAYVFFLFIYKRAVRTGLLARYSAESVS